MKYVIHVIVSITELFRINANTVRTFLFSIKPRSHSIFINPNGGIVPRMRYAAIVVDTWSS